MKPSLASLTNLYLKIGNTTFGGGDPTMALLQRELIFRKWITQEDFALAYSLARVTPGTNVLAFCAATGARVLGLAGAFAAVLAVTLPSAILAVLLTRGFEAWRTQRVGDGRRRRHRRRRVRHDVGQRMEPRQALSRMARRCSSPAERF